jgi:hypothetical protein
MPRSRPRALLGATATQLLFARRFEVLTVPGSGKESEITAVNARHAALSSDAPPAPALATMRHSSSSLPQLGRTGGLRATLTTAPLRDERDSLRARAGARLDDTSSPSKSPTRHNSAYAPVEATMAKQQRVPTPKSVLHLGKGATRVGLEQAPASGVARQ